MTNITVFGKPRAFESYDYVFGGESSLPAENVHREPILKPKSFEDSVLHYFVKDNQIGLECYKRVRGFESDRDGIVFGVAIKSTTDFNIVETLSNVLMPFWSDFASVFLDGTNRFNTSSIIEALSTTKWSQEEISRIQYTSNGKLISSPQKDLLLLVATDMNSISTVEHLIKEYSDVYIANNIEIFKEPINEVVLKQTNKQIYTIGNGILKLVVKEVDSQITPASSKPNNRRHWFDWFNKPIETEENLGSNVANAKTPKEIWIIAASIALLLASVFCCNQFRDKTTRDEDTQDDMIVDTVSTDSEVREELPTSVLLSPYSRPIMTSWKLEPKIEPEGCSYVSSDIEFEVLDDNTRKKVSFVCIEECVLKVISRPQNDTKIVVTASINGTELGSETYTIAKAEATSGNSPTQKPPIPLYKGKPRTCALYITNLEGDLGREPQQASKILAECQKIINREYNGVTDEDVQNAIKLRDKIKNMKKPGI